MPIPSVKSGQTEQEYISECIPQIIDEYGEEQSASICYSTYRKETKMSTRGKISSYLREEAYKGINITKLQEDGLEDACWPGWKALGTKVLDGRVVPNCIPEEDHPDSN